MALSLKEKLKQAAATRMAETAGDTNARLDGMDAKAGLSPAQVVPLKLRTETPAAYGDTSAPHPDTTSQHLKTTPQPDISTPHVGTSAPHPDTSTRQDNPASQSSTTETPAPYGTPQPEENGQTKRSDQTVGPDGQTERTDQTVTPPGQTKRSDQTVGPKTRSDQTVRPESLPERSDQTVNQVGPNGQTKRSDRTVRPDGQTVILNKARPLAKTAQQRAVYGYLAANPDILTSTHNLSEILTIAPTTLRKILDCLERGGAIRKTRIGNDGLRIQFTNAERSDQTVGPNGQTERSDRLHSKKDRKKEDLSISQETLETAWPSLARAGFGTDQLAQIARSLAEQGKATDKVVQGLDHAEWELAAGRMLDKTGQPVADPCAWVFRSLASAGYYRRPAGYVSPAEQAERDAEDEARAVAERREKARQARFEAWVKGLPPQERKDALQGRMGPEKEWLKKVWIERGEPS